MRREKEALEAPIARKEALKSLAAAGAGLLALVAGNPGKAMAAVGRAVKGPKWGMLADLKRCIGCRACTVACKSENEVPLGAFRSYVHYLETGKYPEAKRFFAFTACNHCDEPPCVEVCPVEPSEGRYKRPDGVEIKFEKKASHKRPDGVVLVDYDTCIGCHMCVEACPYKARFVDPHRKAGANPDSNTVGKCTYCVHRLDQGMVPSCVQTCLGGALLFGDLNDPGSEISRRLREGGAEVWKPEAKTGPNVHYLGLQDKRVLGEEVHSL